MLSSKKEAYEQRLDSSEGRLPIGIWGMTVQGRETSKCKGPQVGMQLACYKEGRPVWQWVTRGRRDIKGPRSP